MHDPRTPLGVTTTECPACLGLPECTRGCQDCGGAGEVETPPGDPDLEAQVEEAREAVETGVQDARGDFPEVGEDDLYHDIVLSVAAMYPPAVGAEVRRRLGF
jgi:hypothetical protein